MRDKEAAHGPAPLIRVILEPDVADTLDRWVTEINSKVDHVNLRRMDLVNWLIRSRPVELSPREQMRLAESHNDELAFAVWAHKRIREARAEGKQATIEQLLRERTEALSRAFKVSSDDEKTPVKKTKFSSEIRTNFDANVSSKYSSS